MCIPTFPRFDIGPFPTHVIPLLLQACHLIWNLGQHPVLKVKFQLLSLAFWIPPLRCPSLMTSLCLTHPVTSRPTHCSQTCLACCHLPSNSTHPARKAWEGVLPPGLGPGGKHGYFHWMPVLPHCMVTFLCVSGSLSFCHVDGILASYILVLLSD